MANAAFRKIVKSVVESWACRVVQQCPSLQHGKKKEGAWYVEESRYGLHLYNTWWHKEKEHGFGSGPLYTRFQVFFRFDNALSDYKLHFVDKPAQYMNKKYDLRSSMEPLFTSCLEETCSEMGQYSLFVGEQS